jgi:hypothetical protein
VSQPLFRNFFAAVLFTVITASVYYPALHRVFFGDQLLYFAELHGETSLAAGLELTDYTFSRQYWRGDDALFRPLSIMWLAAGNTLFSYHNIWWNVVTLALHVLVTFSVFQLLLRIRSSEFALPMAALFAVMMPSLELVVWNHLGGYLLGYLFLAVSLQAFAGLTQAKQRPSSIHIAIYVSAFILAVFFHETLVAVCLVASCLLCIAWQRRKTLTPARGLVVFAPVILFTMFYVPHAFRVARLAFVDRAENARLFEPGAVLAIPGRSLFAVGRWLGDILVPSAVSYQVTPFARLYSTLKFSWVTPSHLWNALLAVAILWLVWTVSSRLQMSRNRLLILVAIGALFAHLGVIALGRGQTEVLTTMYYRYLFSMLVVVVIYAVSDFDRVRPIAWVLLVLLIGLHGIQTFRTARQVGLANRSASDYLSRLTEFVDAHKSEAGFSFAVQNAPAEVDPEMLLVEGYPDKPNGPERKLRTSEILFARYYRAQNPRYLLEWNKESLAVKR